MAKYSYIKDFNSDKLLKELNDAGFTPSNIEQVGSVLNIYFDVDQDQTALDALVSAHNNTIFVPVSPRQIRLALVNSGYSLATIQSNIDALSEPQKSQAQISWEYSVEFYRDNALLNMLAPSMGFSPQDLDNLFSLAKDL